MLFIYDARGCGEIHLVRHVDRHEKNVHKHMAGLGKLRREVWYVTYADKIFKLMTFSGGVHDVAKLAWHIGTTSAAAQRRVAQDVKPH